MMLTRILMAAGLIALRAGAATYYVDFVGGNNASAGTATGTAFKHCPGDPKASGTAASTSLAAGDRVIFKGGVQYDSFVTVNASGTPGSKLVFDGDSGFYVTRWGSGTDKAILDGGGTNNACFNFSTVRSNIVINAFELRNTQEAANNGRIIYMANASHHITISSNSIHDAGYVNDDGNRSGTGIFADTANNLTIVGNVIYDCPDTGIYLNDGSTNSVIGNTITDKTVWGIRVAASFLPVFDTVISNNVIHDLTYYDLKGPHTDFVFLNTVGSVSLNNTRIVANTFYNNEVFTNYDGTAMIFAQCSGTSAGTINGTYIWNNVFNNPHSYYVVAINNANANMDGVQILNNSWNCVRDEVPMGVGAGTSFYMTNLVIKNNVTKQGSSAPCIWLAGPTPGAQIDYNNWSTPMAAPFKVDSDYWTWAQWQGLGYDAAGLGSTSNPLFTAASSTSWDLSLQSGSPCINSGSPLALVSTDINGTARPIGVGPEKGAFEFAPAVLINQASVLPLVLRIAR